jgi:hypothetical protein
MEHEAPGGGAYLELCCRPNIDLISSARRFIADFFERAIGDGDTIARMAMAAHELLENAVKYSSDGNAFMRVEVTPQGKQRNVEVLTRNRTSPERFAELRRRVDEMARYTDPFDYYRFAMERSCLEAVGSGLGLARILAEGEMTISLEREGDEISLIARTQLSTGALA